MRFHFDERKSWAAKSQPQKKHRVRRGAGSLFAPYYLDQRSDWPEQYRAIGWVGEHLYAVIFEVREDEEGEYYHLVTLWKATRAEHKLYEEHS
jgi:uncharacterized DUF497 family protein